MGENQLVHLEDRFKIGWWLSTRTSISEKEADSNLSKLLSEDTDIEKLGDLPF